MNRYSNFRKKGISIKKSGLGFFFTSGLFLSGLSQSNASSCSTIDGSTGGTSVANGGTCSVPVGYNPRDHDNLVGGVSVTDGDTIILTGEGTGIETGNRGIQDNTLGTLNPSANGQERLLLGPKTLGVNTRDPVTGANIVVAAYNSSSFSSSDWGQFSGVNTQTPTNVGDNQYIDARLGTVQNGTLNVNIGDNNQLPSAVVNTIDMAAKQTILTQAEGPNSAIVWTSKNKILLGDALVASPGTATQSTTIDVPVYAGTFNGFDGQSWTVSNESELAQYNNALIAALQNGQLSSQAAYDQAFSQAVSFTTQNLTWDYTIDAGDDITLNAGTNYSMYATGGGAQAIIQSGGQIDQRGASVAAVNGAYAEIENGAQLSGHFNSLFIGSSASGVNNGVISGGYFAENGWDTTGPGNYFNEYGEAYTVTVDGIGTNFSNNGIINVAGWTQFQGYSPDSWGIRVQSGATASNSGIINTGVNNNSFSNSISAVIVANGGASNFTNTSSGLIYLGRAAQYDVDNPETVTDVANDTPQYGILLSDGQALNNGTIEIGSLTENAVAMAAVASSPTGSLINNGQINIRGAAGDSPLQNVGILAQNNGQTVVQNGGTITVAGVNGVGLKVVANSGNASASTLAGSAIDVSGDIDPASGTRNYGIWTQGYNASASVEGDIILSGQGGIGVLARDGASVNIGAGSAVQFNEAVDPAGCPDNCSDQIGYLVYGAGSAVTNQSQQLDVTSSGSTLFRIEDGASFSGSGQSLTASGKNANIITGSGANTTINTDSGSLTVSGEGGTAIAIDGGATGTIQDGTTINLTGAGAVAGLVDGRKVSLAGTAGDTIFPSRLTNNATIQSSATDAVGFIAQYGGTLENNASITLSSPSNNTGVLVREGGVLDNNSDISVDNGTGVLVEGATSAAIMNNQGTINVSDGIAGIYLRDGARLNSTGSGEINAAGTANGVLLGTDAQGVILGANVINVTGTGSGLYNTQQGTDNTLNGTTINTATGSAILNEQSSSWRLDNAQLNAATGWAIQNSGGNSTITASNTLLTGGEGVLITENGASTSLTTTSSQLNGRILTNSAVSNLNLTSDSQWNMSADSNVTNLTNDGSVVNFDTGGAFKTLTINQDYVGNGGLLRMNTALGDDNSPTDRLIVEGNTSGTTLVSVLNAGGSGAQTINGIELITVNGNSAGVFNQSGRIAAGAYDYFLVRGEGSNSRNWYLTNRVVTPPVDPGNPEEPGQPGQPGQPEQPGQPGQPGNPTPSPNPGGEPVIRPENLSYTANLVAANNMFVLRLHDRLGETQYTDILTGESKVTSMWMRNVGGHTRFRDETGQVKTQANRYVVQIGGDIAQWSRNGQERFHLGIMGGYANQQSNSRSSISGYQSNGTIHGYSAGVYGTWYQNEQDRTGLHIDSWLMYSWFDNTVSGEDLPSESYKSKGVTASLESGYTFHLADFTGSKGSVNQWYLQPKAQVIWMGVESDDHREANGTLVQGEGDGNVQTRLGLKTYLKGHNAIDEGLQREFQPFIEANWIHNTRNFATTLNGVTNSQEGSRNIGELKTGVEGQINPRLQVWGNVAAQVGDAGYSDTSAMLGVKYSW
ncbi:autotransporter outer membrane beta-barrel domain-containing protein [Enterobacter roggenkampii]|uniref:autotransporter outer membrane beta-barrel domain-containing protein n=1 Tax=Enterobacter roggenkampii TaxID=1812935 RepID=UPI000BA03D1E|nr:autotransporter outer membrane beta-barrel domain-containing protein [Enterobacter roggenkampii]OZU98602.1 autotransporter outer membrane beta-barrel domain-containing protein [Enterobacter roggenkampii]WFC89308.1 autotransporter outer membrane beta-barrel domain-containing protein [Enterobacter roggenkampii]